MFSSGPRYQKLTTNLRLVVNRLKLLEKKKTELALKARKEIADYLANGKEDRARIRVEHIIREDYMVEAMEIIEMYCDLLLARMGLIQSAKELDPGMEEPIASILWATPRLQADVAEMRIVNEQLTAKYGKEFAQHCRTNSLANVNEKLLHKLSVQAPPRMLVEKYLEEIARTYKVPFTPDPNVMADEAFAVEGYLIDFNGENRPGGAGGAGGRSGGGGHTGGGGGGGAVDPSGKAAEAGGRSPVQTPFTAVQQPGQPPFSYPQPSGPQPPPAGFLPGSGPGSAYPTIPPACAGFVADDRPPVPAYNELFHDGGKPKPEPGKARIAPGFDEGIPPLPDLPPVPDSTPSGVGRGQDDVDFDDLARRFEELKRRK